MGNDYECFLCQGRRGVSVCRINGNGSEIECRLKLQRKEKNDSFNRGFIYQKKKRRLGFGEHLNSKLPLSGRGRSLSWNFFPSAIFEI